MYEGRRGRWFCELKLLFGSDFFDHVIYLDTVGSSISNRPQRVVITDRHLYMFNDNVKKIPEPYCLLTDINDLDIDHDVLQTYRNQREYDPHHISFTVLKEKETSKQIDLYTFEYGTDLYWKLKNSIEFAKRNVNLTGKRKEPTPPDMVELVKMGNQKVTANTYYTLKFNKISSRVVQTKSFEDKIQALDELEEIAQTYFPTRTIFFQSTTLLTFLIDTLTFLSDYHAVPIQVKGSRFDQIRFIAKILHTISIYLQGCASVPDALRLVTYNKACHFRTLVHSIFQIEFFIISQPKRFPYFQPKITDKEEFMLCLHEIENSAVSLCYQLHVLATLAWRTQIFGITSNFFIEIIKEKESLIITGGFHTFVYILIQMCYAMQDMEKPLPPTYTQSIYDHLWLINFFISKIPSAAQLIRDEFVTEIDIIVTEDRMRAMIPLEHHNLNEIIKFLNNIRQIIKDTKSTLSKYKVMPVQFR